MLFEGSGRSFAEFAEVPSNAEATSAAIHFARGLTPFVVLIGPTGWGKTHLLDSAYDVAAERNPGRTHQKRLASEWLRDGFVHEQPDILVLDDLQEVLSRTRSRIQLRLGLERRLRAHKPTMLAIAPTGSERQFRTYIPGASEWLVAHIAEPNLDERSTIIHHMASAEGLDLLPELRSLLARRIPGDGRSLNGALKRLKMHGNGWQTPAAALKACGILEPHLAEDGVLDLKHQIRNAMRETATRYGDIDADALGIYVMLRRAGIGEADVARYFGVRPSQAYAHCSAVRNRIKECDRLRDHLDSSVEQLVASLARE